jgi:hypothetical protein
MVLGQLPSTRSATSAHVGGASQMRSGRRDRRCRPALPTLRRVHEVVIPGALTPTLLFALPLAYDRFSGQRAPLRRVGAPRRHRRSEILRDFDRGPAGAWSQPLADSRPFALCHILLLSHWRDGRAFARESGTRPTRTHFNGLIVLSFSVTRRIFATSRRRNRVDSIPVSEIRQNLTQVLSGRQGPCAE